MSDAHPRIWVKICANTSAEDALLAASLGADALGFVFAPSTRRVTPAQVRTIAASLPASVERVGVFPAASPQQIAEAVVEARLHAVQLHGGDLSGDFLDALAALLPANCSVIPTLHWGIDDNAESALTVSGQLSALTHSHPGTRVLIDTKVGTSASGGTGRTFDWNAARTAFSMWPSLRTIVAGGLNPGNVAQAIHLLLPWGVDVASGVESSPGHKDPQKLAAFIENARGA